jgi:signal recognition particle subunit SRP54
MGKLDTADVDEGRLVRIEAMIDSMTPRERRNPKVLGGSRKKRIARGSGTRVQDVNQLLKDYRAMRKMMKSVKGSWLKRTLGGR